MFTLVFLVMFNIKKGSVIAYSSTWGYNFSYQLNLLLNTMKEGRILLFLKYRFHFTAITSRFTTYVLFLFWIFFFFYGEVLLLVVLNYSTPIDTILSSSFFIIKQHIIFYLLTISSKLTSHINFYIFYLTLSAFLFLLNYNYVYNYNFNKINYYNTVRPNIIIIAFILIALYY